eukprot:6261899-Prymnesium_polylepis.1
MWGACDCGVHSHNSKSFPRYRVPQRVTTRVRALRKPSARMRPLSGENHRTPPGTDVYDRPAARAVGGSMH